MSVPPPGFGAAPLVQFDENEGHELLEEEFACEYLNEDRHVCGHTFSSSKAVFAHARRTHGVLSQLWQLVVTNQCPVCLSTFASKTVQ